MPLNIKSTNMDLTAAIKQYVNEKAGEFEKYFNNIQQIDVEVGKTRAGQQKGNIFFCEINLSVPGKLLRYRKETDDLYKSINESRKGIKIEIKKYKERL